MFVKVSSHKGVLNASAKKYFYAVHVSGWWLSMAMKDSFLNKLQSLENFPRLFEKKERFGTYNEKTLGFLLVN